jgi:hypothetical protein
MQTSLREKIARRVVVSTNGAFATMIDASLGELIQFSMYPETQLTDAQVQTLACHLAITE